jgi:F-type H+-transporting ATPase subunit delta
MRITKQARRDAKHLFNACRVNGVLDDAKVRQTVQTVLSQKPRAYLSVLSQFQRLVKLEGDRRSVRVENAVETTPAQMDSIRANLTARYGPGLDITFRVNPQLIGGLRVKVGSDVYDGSVRARLNGLEESF